MHTYHISLLDIPNTDFKPRVVDDRLGYFTQFIKIIHLH